MGQQQLLLLVIGIVIVGLAVVVGIQQFSDGSKRAEVDHLTADAVRMATGASAWRTTPAAMGGGKGAASFAAFGLASLGFENIVLSTPDNEVAFDGTSYHSVWQRTGAATYVAVINGAYDVQARAYLYGRGPACIAMQTGRDAGTGWVYTPATTPPVPAGCAW